ncbi:1,4-dihydroxy-6-naphthoate synthase [Pontibacter sp. G13]|uniref:1,4-dihydroxy-6-naphthoate synthase n=1 Tax=Pontibacter sp. G13 TaxID=3074898 RepID=UPI00288A2735|nr:1,4-dihydroxy-6-naphthoate synthase [Pontibacter sp. G13]WNJ15922.1 1,4-dihydroxy-6-naphthoate synthase [Pontibacter sp. G13]
MKIKLGFSTCPNDTFMFDALVNGRIETGPYKFECVLADILHLNQMARDGELDMVKISYNTLGQIWKDYQLLDAGSALGHNCGPLLISKRALTPEDLQSKNLSIAIPGKYTTANLLMGYFLPQAQNKKEMIFHEIMPAILNDEVDAGVIIHENRFTYQTLGLNLIQDLGEYWESQTELPIPLGAIVARKSFPNEVISELQSLLRLSVEYAFANPQASSDYVRLYAQEMEPEVMQAHINLYVNEYSQTLGAIGKSAVDKLLSVGTEMGLYPTEPQIKIL